MTTATEILAWCARATWHDSHGGAECPADAVPCEADLSAWLPSCPTAAKHEAGDRLAPVLGAPGAWLAYRNVAHLFTVRRLAEPAAGALAFGDGAYAVAGDLASVHQAWLALPDADRPRHPLAPIVAAWQGRPREVEPDRRRTGIMPRFAGELLAPGAIIEADRDRMPLSEPLMLVPSKPDGQLWLPGLDPQSTNPEAVPALLLAMLDAGTLAQPGAGAPLRDRAFVEPLMLAMREDRALGERFYIRDVRIADVVTWFAWNPARYRPDDDAYGGALKRAMTNANAVEIPLAGGGFLFPVFFEAVEGLRPESRLVVSVRLLAGSGHGAGVVRAVLRQTGKVSAVAWRLYLAFCFDWNRIAYKGRVPHLTQPEVLRDARGRLTNADGTLIAGPDPTWPKRRRDATPADRPVTDWRDSRAIEIGREPNPRGESLHRVYDAPRDLVRAAFPLGTKATQTHPKRTEEQAVKAVRWLAGEIELNRQSITEPGVRIVRLGRATKTGNPHGFPWRIVPPWTR